MNTWFSIKAQATGKPTEVSVYDDIGGWGVPFASFAESIKAIQGPILLRINSYGGDVFAGLAMHNLLKQRGNVDTVIEGVAASAATLPFLAGRKRSMPRGSYFMVHNPLSGVMGGAADMREAADLLERIGGTLADLYASVTGIDKAEVQRLMDAETWLDGAAAVEGKWATDLIDGEPVLASVRPGQFRNAPAAVLSTISPPEPDGITNKMKSKLLALLGVEANAKETFLASAIADLGVKPEAVSAALDAGQTGFLAEHIQAAVNAAKAEADKLRPEASLLADVRASLGVPATADKAALLAVIEAKASARAAELAAKAGVSNATLNAAAGKPVNDDGTREEIVAKFNSMKPGPERSAFFAKHRGILIS